MWWLYKAFIQKSHVNISVDTCKIICKNIFFFKKKTMDISIVKYVLYYEL